MADKKEDKSYDTSNLNESSGSFISGTDEYLAANKSQKQEKNDYVNLWKKIKNNSVFQSQEQNKKISDAVENYVKGSAFKQIIEDRTKKAVNEYAKEKEFKQIVNDVIKDTEERLRDKIDDSKLKTIETLGIFVALFTFVSIDFQLFRIFHTPESIGGLISILSGSLFLFLLVLDFVINSADNIKKKFYPLFIFSVALIIGGIYIFIKSPQENINIDNELKIENQGASLQINGNSMALPQK